MTRLVLETPASPAATGVELANQSVVLVGREPDWAAMRPGLPAAIPPSEPHLEQVADPSVSGNHVAAWQAGESTFLLDVGSRNGTWLRLPPHRPVRVDGAASLSLRLAALAEPLRDEAEPADATWTSTADYAAGLTAAVESWLAGQGVRARIVRVPSSRVQGGGDRSCRVALSSGEELLVLPQETMDRSWVDLMAVLLRYVGRQNSLFEAEQASRDEGMILASPAIRRAHRQVVEAARRGARGLLLIGPSGSGKEGLARAFDRYSGRSGPFVARNCAMFSKEFLRAELFGAEAGSFTGCTQRIPGAVERANGGTLFLDELGEMPADVQPFLLTFLDRGEYERMGEYGRVRQSNVRVVSATNRNLREVALRGEFRIDLWFRLSTHVVEVPSLSERPEDLIAWLRSRPMRPAGTLHDALSADALALLLAHNWQGNFRELQNFAGRLPDQAPPGGIRIGACREALEAGSLSPVPRHATPHHLPPTSASHAFPDLAARALASFAEDYAHASPVTWDEVKDYVEKYFKPLVLAHLAGISASTPAESVDQAGIARALAADRGTIKSQLARLRERFWK